MSKAICFVLLQYFCSLHSRNHKKKKNVSAQHRCVSVTHRCTISIRERNCEASTLCGACSYNFIVNLLNGASAKSNGALRQIGQISKILF